MDYKNASCVLPDDLIAAIQQHVDGEYLYIPRKAENKKGWGELKNSRRLLHERNIAIFEGYRCGASVEKLAEKYYLSPKSIYKILAAIKYDK
ncbi:CD3324 family protein [Sinanaerobacter sp. ZZT-01]|uniref:CD3324 family protein n=1 Tax=Sinanaerobacter sp. ZZT-01 TaxID=3111540 RepID=UPI002D77B02A|nr:CD3324 family protein [Sinanaerobacter sp. ZZT-01]WRR93732.1 CD3324 family protein [Sinanaerobacter sp. ZZT-01]